MLIDGGPSSRIVSLLGQELPFYDRHLNLVVLTHSDRDHLYGLLEVIKRYRIDRLMLTSMEGETQLLEQFRRLVAAKGIPIEVASARSDFTVEGVRFDFLHPGLQEIERGEASDNDLSLVLWVNYQSGDFLFMGDASSKVEERREIPWPDVEVLQVAHHGSGSSTSSFFLQQTTPSLAVVSVGKNSYGHPSPAVLDRLEAFKVRTVRTDQSGTIRLFMRDNRIRVETEKKVGEKR